MSRIIAALVCISLISSPSALYAHGGGLDANGCHIDNSTSTTHCHPSGEAEEDPSTAFIALGAILAVALIGYLVSRSLVAKQTEQATQETPQQPTRFTWDFTGSIDGNGAGAGVLIHF